MPEMPSLAAFYHLEVYIEKRSNTGPSTKTVWWRVLGRQMPSSAFLNYYYYLSFIMPALCSLCNCVLSFFLSVLCLLRLPVISKVLSYLILATWTMLWLDKAYALASLPSRKPLKSTSASHIGSNDTFTVCMENAWEKVWRRRTPCTL